MQNYAQAYAADSSLKGKAVRRWARLRHQRPLPVSPGRPILSISFDDAPLTSTTTGADILESRGVSGTYYASAGLAGTEAPMGVCASAEDYLRLSAAGHEIACHTSSHLDCGRANAAAATADVTRNLRLSRPGGCQIQIASRFHMAMCRQAQRPRWRQTSAVCAGCITV